MSAPRRVLITGGTGGLGLALVDFFAAQGYRVRATGRKTERARRITEAGAEFMQADLEDSHAMEMLCKGQDSVIHAAALSKSWGPPERFDCVNVDVTRTLVEHAKSAGCSRFVFVSSPSIYAAMRDQLNLTESDTPSAKPLNDYARTKLAAEKFVLSQNAPDFQTAAIRPRAIVGPDDDVLLPKLMEMLKKGFLPLFRQGKSLVELTDVRDVAKAVVSMEQNMGTVSGKAVNISGGKAVTMRDLALGLSNATGYRLTLIPFPVTLGKILAVISEKKSRLQKYETEPALTNYKLATMAYSQTFDLKRAREELGYRPEYDALKTLLDIAKVRVT